MAGNKYKTLFSNTAVFALSNIMSKVILSLLLPLYTRMLTTEEYAIAELVITISQLIIPVASAAIQDAVFRFCMDTTKNADDIIKNGLVILLAGNILLLCFSAFVYAYPVISECYIYFYFLSSFSMLRSMLSLYTKAIGKTIIFSIDNVLYNMALAVLNLLLLWGFHLKLDGYFSAIIIANLISIIYLSVKNKIWKIYFRGTIYIKIMKEMLIYSAPLILNSIMWGIANLVDKVMLTQLCSVSSAGIYSAASKIPSILSLVTGVFTQAWALSAIQDYETEKDSRFYETIFRITHIGVLLCALLVLLLNNHVILFVLGTTFSDAVRYVPVLLIGAVFLTYSNFYSPIYSAMKMSRQVMYSSAGGTLLNVILNFVFIPRIGILGACIATTVEYIFIAVYRMADCRRCFPMKIDSKKWTISIVVLLVGMVCTMLQFYEVFVLVLLIGASIILYRKELNLLIKSALQIISRRGVSDDCKRQQQKGKSKKN